jgi:phosphoadenosine phosphosulfate reductase
VTAPAPQVLASSEDELRWLNTHFATAPTDEMLRAVIEDLAPRRTALVSSFGTESVVTLWLVAGIAPQLPVIFLDTGKHFDATLRYVEALQTQLGLTDLRVVRAAGHDLAGRDPHGLLHRVDADACCALRKLEPLQAALEDFAVWITGRKRTHGGARSDLQLFDRDRAGRLRVNPLCHWDSARMAAFIAAHSLPPHPLADSGYDSVGCAPCTARRVVGGGLRDGRWPGQLKTECGIHML